MAASAEVNARIAAGEAITQHDYYLRIARFFEASAPKYEWLNKMVAVPIGLRQPEGVTYEVF